MAPRTSTRTTTAAALRDAAGNLSRRLRQVRGDEDGTEELSWRERQALGLLVRVGPSTSAELARIERIRPQSMVSTLKALADRGLVERGHDPGDGRRVVLTVTAAGKRLHRARMDTRLAQFTDALEAEFTAAEIDRLAAAAPLLDRLADRIAADAPDHDRSPRRTR